MRFYHKIRENLSFLLGLQGVRVITKTCNQSNNIVEQDHRAVKQVTRPILGFKAFHTARRTLVGIELMHMLKKKQLEGTAENEGRSAAELFYSLAV